MHHLRSFSSYVSIIISVIFMLSNVSAVDLVSKSNGLGLPAKEEGHTEFETGDFNGDGYLDIVSVGDHGSPHVNSDEHGIMVWLGNGAGQWTVHQYGNFGYGGCAVGDLNLDGLQDVAWGIHHDWGSGMGDSLLNAALGDGTGQAWTEWGQGLGDNGEDWGMFATALADFDCDGKLDIVSQSFGGSNGVRVYRNNGDGTWTQAWSQVGGSVGYTIETCDINGDGYPDIVCTRTGTEVYLGDGAFGFTVFTTGLPSGGIYGIDAGDINNDGYDDISFRSGSGGVRCYRYDSGLQSWIDASNGLPSSGSYDLTQIGDIDGDGNSDITVFSSPAGQVFLGDGSGNWTADDTWTMPSPGDASALRVDGDMDHDGREDIIIMADKEGFPFYRNQLRCYSPWSEPLTLTAGITAPNGGETFRNGSVRDISWLSGVPLLHGSGAVDIELSVNSDQGPWVQVAADQPNSGRYQWSVYSETPSENCRLRVHVVTDQGTVVTISDFDFSILGDPPAITPTPTPGVSTPTPDPPTYTPTAPPGEPTYTPPVSTATPEPTTTETPGCETLGVTLWMPSDFFRPGDKCSLIAYMCNPEDDTHENIPLFVILDIYGEYFFAPSFTDFDCYSITLLPGLFNLDILLEFDWPEDAGNADGIRWIAGMTNQTITELFGEYDIFEFGWHQ